MLTSSYFSDNCSAQLHACSTKPFLVDRHMYGTVLVYLANLDVITIFWEGGLLSEDRMQQNSKFRFEHIRMVCKMDKKTKLNAKGTSSLMQQTTDHGANTLT